MHVDGIVEECRAGKAHEGGEEDQGYGRGG
jgi:hypothetical protein